MKKKLYVIVFGREICVIISRIFGYRCGSPKIVDTKNAIVYGISVILTIGLLGNSIALMLINRQKKKVFLRKKKSPDGDDNGTDGIVSYTIVSHIA